MATVKISALTTITGASVDQANDVIPIVDATGPETKKITVAQLLGLVSLSVTTGTTTTTGTTGSVLFCDTGVVQQDNTNLYWDNTNNRLGIGATGPNARLEVRAPGALSTSYVFRLRNSANTVNLVEVTGDGFIAFSSNANELGFNQDSAGYTGIGTYANNTYGLAVQRKGSAGIAYFGFSGSGTVMTVANAGTGGGTGINCSVINTSGFCAAAYFTATGASLVNWGLVVNASNATDHNYALKIQGGDISLEATGGHKIGVLTTQKISLWNQTPIVQPASANQAALTNSTGGTYDGTLAAVAGTGDDATINNNFTDIYTLLNAMRTAMVDFGSMKGSA